MDINNYILVTPCYNEELNLPKLANSVINQTIPAKLWVIVDDGSSDKTPQISQKLSRKHNWIKILHLHESKRDLGIHVAEVYRSGLQFATNYCNVNHIDFEYIGVVDADIILPNDYFKQLIDRFENDQKLGICSGRGGNIISGEIIWEKQRGDLPSGGARLWRKKCFFDTNGYGRTCCPDSVSNVKAKLRNWGTKMFDDINFVSTRPHAGAEGQWNGHKKLGANNYFIGYTPIHILLKGIHLMYSSKCHHEIGVGIAYILGYFKEYFKNAPKTNDKEIIEYYRNNRLKEILWMKLRSHQNAK